jgi:membrane peptidoglycan carboxypeptidase
MSPYQVLRVVDRQGNVLEENHPEPHDAIRADTAYVMTTLLQGVTTRGTAATAASLDWPIAGKTGTMDEYTDAWFIGFDPDITIGVWLGYDEKKSLGQRRNGRDGRAADLDRRDEGLPRQARSREPAVVPGAGQHRLRVGGQVHRCAVERRRYDHRRIHRRHATGRRSRAAAQP